MNYTHALSLLLAISMAGNIGFIAGIAAWRAGIGWERAFLIGGGAAGSGLAIIFSGMAIYR
ncbi:hypothetical protein AB0K43_30085 [Kitasatospora sp. NPDC049258]|uniref:hypothetical protein n=1 Tax=Kitasatospora sp. NPDC049258 TaxID=3155394 RepID=UPI0034318C2D